ncbi:MAG: hypothetical protein U1E65_15105 [Myxococcota bacterium]
MSVLALLLWGAVSTSTQGPSVVLEGAGSEDALRARLRAELGALGYAVLSADASDAPQAAARLRVLPEGVEVWVAAERRAVIAEEDQGLLALKSAETLRACLHDLSVPSPSRPSPSPPTAPELSMVSPEPPRPVHLELGARALLDPGGDVGAAPLILARARLELGDPWAVGLELMLPTAPARVSGAAGTASVYCASALLDATLSLSFDPQDHLRFGAGLGLLGLFMSGAPATGYQGRDDVVWALGSELSVAYGRTLGPLRLWLELSALLALPRPVVRFGGREAADVARPALGVSLLVELPL